MNGVDLSRLNISLDSFNAAASGKYNIGQIKLSEDGTSVYRVNNHKTWTIFNNTKISQEEALAVKEAFCKAISREAKLDKAQTDEVKKQLGICNTRVQSMTAGPIKALTAAEVRQIIDKYANDINGKRTEKLKTSDDLYKGVSQKTLTSRAQTRDKINQQTFNKVVTKSDKMVNAVLDLVSFEGGDSYNPEQIKMMRGLARLIHRKGFSINKPNQTIALKEPPIEIYTYDKNDNKKGVKRDPTKGVGDDFFEKNKKEYKPEDLGFRAKITLENGSEFTLDLGLNKTQLLKKAADIIDQFDVPTPPTKTFEAKPKIHVTDPLKMSKSSVNDLKQFVLDEIKDAFNELKNINTETHPHDLKKIRNKGPANSKLDGGGDWVDALAENLQKALVAVRGHDLRNAPVVNALRDAFWQNPHLPNDPLKKKSTTVENGEAKPPAGETNPTDKNALYDELFNVIEKILTKDRKNFRDEIYANIDNSIKEQEKIKAQNNKNNVEKNNKIEDQNNVGNNQEPQQVEEEDDGFEPLNINRILGNTDEFGKEEEF